MKRTGRWLIMLSLIFISGIIPALEAQTTVPATGQLQRHGVVDVSKLSPLSKAGAKLMLHPQHHKDVDAFVREKARANTGASLSSGSALGPRTSPGISIDPGVGFVG